MTRYESVLDTVGGTPLIRLTRSAEGLGPRIYVKPEWQNPGGSVKDRAAVSMLRRAEADGSLSPGGTVVEVTSGNTGIGLVLAAAHLGYRTVIFTSSFIAVEKRAQLRAYGAQVRLVDTFVPRDHPDALRAHAERFVAETPGAWLAGQYDNPANPAAHYATTGPEIWADTDGLVTHFVATVGTGGTISGTGRYLREVADRAGRSVRIVGADPITSAYFGGDGSQKYIEGAGHFVHPEAVGDTWPTALDLDVIDDYRQVDDQRAIDVVRWLARTEGILAGGSSGVALAAAFDLAAGLTVDDTVVVLLPDSGRQYLSTYFDDDWLVRNGFARAADAAATVGDLMRPARFVDRGEPVVGPDDELLVVCYPRAGRTLAPHATDVIGWTTAGALRAGPDADLYPFGPRLGIGLSLDDPVGAAWNPSGGRELALVLDGGRVAGVVRHADLPGRDVQP